MCYSCSMVLHRERRPTPHRYINSNRSHQRTESLLHVAVNQRMSRESEYPNTSEYSIRIWTATMSQESFEPRLCQSQVTLLCRKCDEWCYQPSTCIMTFQNISNLSIESLTSSTQTVSDTVFQTQIFPSKHWISSHGQTAESHRPSPVLELFSRQTYGVMNWICKNI